MFTAQTQTAQRTRVRDSLLLDRSTHTSPSGLTDPACVAATLIFLPHSFCIQLKNLVEIPTTCKIKSCYPAVPSVTCPTPMALLPSFISHKTLIWALCSSRTVSTLVYTHYVQCHHPIFAHTIPSWPAPLLGQKASSHPNQCS